MAEELYYKDSEGFHKMPLGEENKIDVIKVNGVEQEIDPTDKSVDLTIPQAPEGHTVYLLICLGPLVVRESIIAFDNGLSFNPETFTSSSEVLGPYVEVKVAGVFMAAANVSIPVFGVKKVVAAEFSGYIGGFSVRSLSGEVLGTIPRGNPIDFPITQDCYIEAWFGACLLYDTPILMADGTSKRICDIVVGDMVLSVSPDTGELEADRVVYADGMENKTHNVKDVWEFSDGTKIETVHRHRFFNIELQEMMYLEAWERWERAYKHDATKPMLVAHSQEQGKFQHCTIFTEKWNNYFANGLLSGNRKSSQLSL